MYFILSESGDRFGPVDLTTLNQFARASVIQPETTLLKVGGKVKKRAQEVRHLSFDEFDAPPVEQLPEQFAVEPTWIEQQFINTHTLLLCLVAMFLPPLMLVLSIATLTSNYPRAVQKARVILAMSVFGAVFRWVILPRMRG